MLIWALVLYRWQMRRCVRIQYGRLCISEQWMEWVTYKVCQIRRSRRGSRALGHRARPRGCRSPRRDSETPQCHTRWLLGWHEERGKGWRKREKMQHEVMVANEVDSRQTGNVNLNVSERERVPAFFIWWKALPIIECCSVSPFFSVRTWGHNFFFFFFFYSARLKSTRRRQATQTLPRHCDFDSSPPPTKTRCPLRLGKLLQSSLASLFLSFLASVVLRFQLMVGTGGVQWKPSQLKSHHSLSIKRASVKVLTCFLPVAVRDSAPSFRRMTRAFC